MVSSTLSSFLTSVGRWAWPQARHSTDLLSGIIVIDCGQLWQRSFLSFKTRWTYALLLLWLKLGANCQTLFFKHRDVSCLKSMLDGLRGQKSCLSNKKMFETMFEQVHNLQGFSSLVFFLTFAYLHNSSSNLSCTSVLSTNVFSQLESKDLLSCGPGVKTQGRGADDSRPSSGRPGQLRPRLSQSLWRDFPNGPFP